MFLISVKKLALFVERVSSILGFIASNSSHWEKLISGAGGLAGVFLVFWVSHQLGQANQTPLVIASAGASAVLVFGIPHGSLSQPWPLLAGHTFSALIGVSCAKLFPGQFLIAAPLAVGLAIAAMHYLRCMHPPGGATALTAVVGGQRITELGYYYALDPVLLNISIILAAGVAVNVFFPWRRYPSALFHTPNMPAVKSGPLLNQDNLENALQQLNSFIDVSEEDLIRIYRLAVAHAEQSQGSSPQVLSPSDLRTGKYYSNGEYGNSWMVRRITAIRQGGDISQPTVFYRIAVGEGRRRTGQCSRTEFAQWAKYEVFLNENAWQRISPSSC